MYIPYEQGIISECDTIRSSNAPFYAFSGHQIIYPEVVIRALGTLYQEYNKTFHSLVEANREWETDYRFCLSKGCPVNYGVQIDMSGLTKKFFQEIEGMSEEDVREILRRRIFEIENSLAMYQLLENLFARGEESFFKKGFRQTLLKIRKRFGKPIALLAVTQEKYNAMKELEFGHEKDSILTDVETFALSGFDRFFGPYEFEQYIKANKGKCEYLLYARTSDPIEKLKNPDVFVEHPLLANPEMRRIIKEHALTFNVDAPDMATENRINDTKDYMSPMGMAFPIKSEDDLYSLEFTTHLAMGKKYREFPFDSFRLSQDFSKFLRDFMIDPLEVEIGEKNLRLKPAKGTFGCYGHLSGALPDRRLRRELRHNLSRRPGGYIIQPEMEIPKTINEVDGFEYAYIDRNFMTMIDEEPMFIGGFRAFLPTDSVEAQKGRNHGSRYTVWAEIIS